MCVYIISARGIIYRADTRAILNIKNIGTHNAIQLGIVLFYGEYTPVDNIEKSYRVILLSF